MIHPGEAQRHMERYENELAGTEACKAFILTQVDPVYFNAIRWPRNVFKGITLLQFLGHLATSISATTEEKAQGKATLLEPWDEHDYNHEHEQEHEHEDEHKQHKETDR